VIGLLYEFCQKCDKMGITPAEKEIDLFLNYINKKEYREDFIRFCFYNWENRYTYLELKVLSN